EDTDFLISSNLSIFSSLCTATHNLEENNFLHRYFLPNEVDVHQVIVLPKAEWERIQDNLSSTTREAARILAEKKEREEMHLRSKAAVKDWPNTIMKLKAKKLRKEREEEERKLLDLEEEQFQVAKRKEAINNAKTYLYYQNERVKGLHSALLLAEVLKERDAQVEFKKLKSDVNKKKDEEKEHEHKEAILREQEKAHQRYMNQQQEHQDKLINQLAVQMNEALKREDDRLARDIAKKEAEQEKKRKEKEAKEKAVIESIAEHRAAVVRNLACSFSCLLQLRSLAQSWWLWCYASGVLHQQAKKQQEKEADLDYDAQTKVIALCEEHEFQSYAKQLIERESKTTHHLYPLLKVSKDRRGLGHGPFSRGRAGIHTSFQAQDGTGTHLPCSTCTTAQKVKT
uniref:CC173 protein n=1 Tax=Athene cunicularia TaxID=194338 RepID=A0A663MGQ8_ATHCN